MLYGATVDPSVVLSWVLPGEACPASLELREKAIENQRMSLCVPPSFHSEVGNVLWSVARRGRIEPEDVQNVMEAITDFRFRVWTPDPLACIGLAFDTGLSVYAASYVRVAEETGTVLWTLDYRQFKAASRMELGVLPRW